MGVRCRGDRGVMCGDRGVMCGGVCVVTEVSCMVTDVSCVVTDVSCVTTCFMRRDTCFMCRDRSLLSLGVTGVVSYHMIRPVSALLSCHVRVWYLYVWRSDGVRG